VSILRVAVFTRRKSGALVSISFAADDVVEKFNTPRRSGKQIAVSPCSAASHFSNLIYSVIHHSTPFFLSAQCTRAVCLS
jgi:hypothetical protein